MLNSNALYHINGVLNSVGYVPTSLSFHHPLSLALTVSHSRKMYLLGQSDLLFSLPVGHCLSFGERFFYILSLSLVATICFIRPELTSELANFQGPVQNEIT